MSGLHEKLTAWLAKTGYPLEMRVASVLTKLGFTTIQSESFQDPVEDKPREVDVVGYLQYLPTGVKHLPEGTHEMHFGLVCECKLSLDRPWIVFTSARERITSTTQLRQTAASQLGKQFLVGASQTARLQQALFFKGPPRLGYSVTTGFDDKDRAYDAIRSVAQATRGIVDFYGSAAVGKPAFAWPVVVVDGPLFECFLNAAGNPELCQSDYCLMAWRNKILGFHSFVHIVTFKGFEDFSRNAHQAASLLLETCYQAQKPK